MPNRWEKLPIPESSRRSLELALEFLPDYLSESTGVDDEVVDFTEKGGWRKIDKLFPLLMRFNSSLDWEDWTEPLRRFTVDVKVSDLPSSGGGN